MDTHTNIPNNFCVRRQSGSNGSLFLPLQTMLKQKKFIGIFQNSTRIFILALITYFAVLHQLKGVMGAPNSHVFCPFGGLESLYRFVAAGGFIPKIMPATMVLFVGTLLLAVFLNRAFCGWICPLGTLQTVFDRLGRFLGIKKIQVPAHVERYLKYLKYAGLVVILFFSWKTASLVYSPYDPWAAYTHIAGGLEELYGEFLIGTIFLLVALIGSLWLPNNFCRYFCPMGAFLALVSKLSPTKIYRNSECLSCGACVAVCPVENTLSYKVRNRFPLKRGVYGILTLALFFSPIMIAKQVGVWKTGYTSVAEVLTDVSGVKNPENIKGSLTLKAVSQEFDIPLEAFITHFNLPADVDPGEMIKNILHPLNLETEELRFFVAEYLEKGEAAVAAPGPPESEVSNEEAHTLAVSTRPSETTSTEQAQVDIRGKTTMDDLLNFGLTPAGFKEIFSIDMPENRAIRLKEFADANGLEMEMIKERLNEALQP